MSFASIPHERGSKGVNRMLLCCHFNTQHYTLHYTTAATVSFIWPDILYCLRLICRAGRSRVKEPSTLLSMHAGETLGTNALGYNRMLKTQIHKLNHPSGSVVPWRAWPTAACTSKTSTASSAKPSPWRNRSTTPKGAGRRLLFVCVILHCWYYSAVL